MGLSDKIPWHFKFWGFGLLLQSLDTYIISKLLSLFFVACSPSLELEPPDSDLWLLLLSLCFFLSSTTSVEDASSDCLCHAGIDGGSVRVFSAGNWFLVKRKIYFYIKSPSCSAWQRLTINTMVVGSISAREINYFTFRRRVEKRKRRMVYYTYLM